MEEQAKNLKLQLGFYDRYYLYAGDWLVGVYEDARTAKEQCKRLQKLNPNGSDRIIVERADKSQVHYKNLLTSILN